LARIETLSRWEEQTLSAETAAAAGLDAVNVLLDAASGGVRVIDLGRPLFAGMPQSPNHPEFRMALQRRHGDVVRADGSSAANEVVITGGHVGTHIDALCHVSYRGHLHGGVDAAAAQVGGRFSKLGVETIAPLVCRGVLLDVPAALHTDVCEPGYEITAEDLDAAAASAGVRAEPDDVLLIRSGWGIHFDNREQYIGHATGVPGVGLAGARWLSSWQPKAVGADTIALEQLAPGMGHALLPVHRHLLVEAGIYIIEAMDLDGLAAAGVHEFLFVASPLKLVGATGSPCRPLAITAAGGRR
jgi:kynurenine formamidase